MRFPMLVAAALFLSIASASAAPTLVHLSGRLLTDGDEPVEGAVTLTVRLFPSDASTAVEIWKQAYATVAAKGVFDVLLGDTTGGKAPLPDTLLESPELWMSVEVGSGGELKPRMRLGGTLWAVRATSAASADTLGGKTADAFAQLAGATFTGPVVLAGAPTADLGAATRKYVDDAAANAKTYADGAIAAAAKPVNVSAPLTGNGTTTPIAITKGSGTVDGFLGAADFARFDAKVDAVTATPPLTITGTQRLELGLAINTSAPLSGAGTAGSPLTIATATATADGAMSKADKAKLDALTGNGLVVTDARPTNPTPGRFIFNTTLQRLEFWDGTQWRLVTDYRAPARTCKEWLARGETNDGLYTVQPSTSLPAFQVWCRMNGEFPGAALAIHKGGSVASEQNVASELRVPCKPDAAAYCKLSDVQINALKDLSTDVDAYIVNAFRNPTGAATCKSYARRTCQWISNGAAGSGCENSVNRNSGQYCSRGQTTASYRGLDGHQCPNLSYPGATSPSNPFVIFEHDGGAHYCGGWDTSWDHVELWVQ